MGLRVEFDTASWISLNLKRINNWKRKSIFMEFLAKTSSSSNSLPISRLSGDTIWTCLFNIDDHVGGVEFINVEIKEFVNQLGHWHSILLLRHVELLNNLQVIFKKCISFIHAIHFLVNVLHWVIMSSPFRIQLLYRYRIIYGFLPLVTEHSFLKAGQYWWLNVL